MGRARTIVGLVLFLAACTSSRDARPVERPTTPETSTDGTDATDATSPDDTSEDSTAVGGSDSTTSTTAGSTTTTTAAGTVRGTAVAGATAEVEASGPPFPTTNVFAEVVRLADGTCVGWAARGGSTTGLAVGAPVVVLEAEQDVEIGRGTIEASRWEDVSGSGGQWNCFFDWSATITGAPAEVRIKVGPLAPWLARPDASGAYVASVSTDAGIGLIPSCPAVPAPPVTAAPGATTVATTAAPTVAPGPPVSGWNAVGQYWSVGVASLCESGLPVTAIARPCRPPGVGSEYIISVTDSADPTIIYPNASAIPAGTQVTVSVATGRPCG